MIFTNDGQENIEIKYIDPHNSKDILEKLLDVLIDNRKFEIGLLWQRTIIFWGFISALFVVLYKVNNIYKFAISLIGFVFSVIWTLVNKGSKAWQQSLGEKNRILCALLFKYEHLYKKAHEDEDINRKLKIEKYKSKCRPSHRSLLGSLRWRLEGLKKTAISSTFAQKLATDVLK